MKSMNRDVSVAKLCLITVVSFVCTMGMPHLSALLNAEDAYIVPSAVFRHLGTVACHARQLCCALVQLSKWTTK